ncbi:MAG: hypothetical protein ACRDYY_17520 [Acidimicrobiales bacterium]
MGRMTRGATRVIAGSLFVAAAISGVGMMIAQAPAGAAARVTAATDAYPPLSASTPLVVTTPTTVEPTTSTTAHGALAFTGADVAGITALGALAIGAGGGVVLLTRRRRDRVEPQ